LFRRKDRHTAVNGLRRMPAKGSPAEIMISSASGGMALKMSTRTATGHLIQRFSDVLARATTRPPRRPLGMTTMQSSKVMPKPRSMIGQA